MIGISIKYPLLHQTAVHGSLVFDKTVDVELNKQRNGSTKISSSTVVFCKSVAYNLNKDGFTPENTFWRTLISEKL